MHDILDQTTLDEPISDIYHINYTSHYVLVSSMMRLQEFYEGSDRVVGKYSTLEESMDAYFLTTHPKVDDFTYFQDWAGFNIPGRIVRDFYELYHTNFTDKETFLFNSLDKHVKNWRTKKFYLIATHKLPDYYNHELAHGLYYIYDDYRVEMDELIHKCSYRKHLSRKLKSLGYLSEHVIDDEIQAYLSTSTKKYLLDDLKIKTPVQTSAPFKTVFRRYKKKLMV